MTYLVIGICIFLLLAVIYISAKPISMGIEARRNIKDKVDNNEDNNEDNNPNFSDYYDEVKKTENSISSEIEKLNDLKERGLLTQEEYEKAKDKILN
tara:strand:+ start:351 stop:641 length:291 start_codon:yes stop_codon:yes gene_type:complete